MKQTDEFEAAPVPAVMLRYEGRDWDGALETFYKENPEQRNKIFIVLLPVDGKFRLETTRRKRCKPQKSTISQ